MITINTNDTVRSITGCLLASDRAKSFRLTRFFGHLAYSAPEDDHQRVIAAAIRPPTDWRRAVGRPRTTWLRTVMRMFSPWTLGSIQHGGRQEIGILGNKSSVRQRSARSSPPRRSGGFGGLQNGTRGRTFRRRRFGDRTDAGRYDTDCYSAQYGGNAEVI